MSRWHPHDRDPNWTCSPPSEVAATFHRTLDGYAPTPLVDLPQIAQEAGVGRVLAKAESTRLGLPAFKALGASWAVHRVAEQHVGERLTFVTATDGNHGRAVARYARLLGHDAEIYCPRGVSDKAVAAIRAEGATVTVLDGTYDDAVTEAARLGESGGCALVQDTSWPGYEDVPQSIVEGYGTMLREVDAQLDGDTPDLILVPTGVGSLLQAVLAHYRSSDLDGSTAVVAVEPDVAACLPPSLEAGRPVTVDTGITSMAGLNCGTVSGLAWPYVLRGLDGVVVVSDDEAAAAIPPLAGAGVDAGPCGAASLAALRELVSGNARECLELDATSTVVLLVTEGAGSS